LAFQVVSLAKERKFPIDVDGALGYAIQLLCADPEAHLLTRHPEIWASDQGGYFRDRAPDGAAWMWRHPLAKEAVQVRPAMVHLKSL